MRTGINVRKSLHQVFDTLRDFHSESIFRIVLDLLFSQSAPKSASCDSWRQDANVTTNGNAADFLWGISSELGFQMRRDMRDDQCVVAVITQLEHVTDAMDLSDQRRLIGRNAKM